jgi:hypothetical protein
MLDEGGEALRGAGVPVPADAEASAEVVGKAPTFAGAEEQAIA